MFVLTFCTSELHWFEITPGSTHYDKCFPDLKSLIGKLIITDLGYWDFNLLWQIKEIGGYDRSRIKSKAVITVTEIIQGKISQKYLGKALLKYHSNTNVPIFFAFRLKKCVIKELYAVEQLVFGILVINVIIGT
jgi:hypothetical protein